MKSRKTQLILAVFLGLFLILFPLRAAASPLFVGTDLVGFITELTVIVITKIVGPMVEYFVNLLKTFIDQTNYYPPQVEASWSMMRNFVNLFFILILIVMAFGTIFDLPKYNWGALLPRFLVAAILINFSFAIGVYIISIGNGLSKIFLGSIGNVMYTLGQGLGAANITEVQRALGGGFSALTTGVLFIIFLIITLFAFATSAIFVLLRIPFLWFLLILSPVAWIGSILPNFKEQTWGNWWKQFIGWVFFLPTYLFFLMFASIFISGRNQIAPASPGITGLGGFFAAFGVNDIFMFAITITFMVGGLGLAMKMSFFAGSKAAEYFGKIEGGVSRVTGLSAVKKGLVQTGARIKEEGLPEKRFRYLGPFRYGGERAERLRAAKTEQFFSKALGFTPELKLQKQQVTDIDAELARLKDQEKAGQIRIDPVFETETMGMNANTVRGAARRAFLYERGRINSADFQNSMANWATRNPFLAQSMSERAAKGNYGGVDRDQLVQMAAANTPAYARFRSPKTTAARKEWFDFIKKDDKALGSGFFNVGAFTESMDLLGGSNTNEGKEFRKEVAKKRPDIVGQYDLTHPPTTPPPADLPDAIFGVISKKSPDDLKDVLKEAMTPDFGDALRKLFVQKQTASPPSPRYPGGGVDFKRRLVNALDPARSAIVAGVSAPGIP